jgi:hypothetical protein
MVFRGSPGRIRRLRPRLTGTMWLLIAWVLFVLFVIVPLMIQGGF